MSKKQLKYVLVIVFVLRLALQTSPLEAQAEQSEEPFWYDVSLGAPLVSWFNETARSYDVARVENISQLQMLDEIAQGQRLVVFKSAAEAEQYVPEIADRIDIIGYNLEHGPLNPIEEQENPVAAIKQLRLLADTYDLKLAVGPDRSFALSHGTQLAPYADIFVLQVQKVQTEPETVNSFIIPLTSELRKVNPRLDISMQIRTEGDVMALSDLIESLRPQLDGVSILTSVETVEVAEALVAELNKRDLGRPLDPTPTAPTVQPKTLEKVQEIGEPANGSPGGLMWLLVVVTSLIAGAIGGGAIATYICGQK